MGVGGVRLTTDHTESAEGGHGRGLGLGGLCCGFFDHESWLMNSSVVCLGWDGVYYGFGFFCVCPAGRLGETVPAEASPIDSKVRLGCVMYFPDRSPWLAIFCEGRGRVSWFGAGELVWSALSAAGRRRVDLTAL